MPEGPEIRREADEIAAAIARRPIVRLELLLPRLKPAERQLQGAKVTRVQPHGKALLIRFDNGLTLYTHNLLYGRWYVERAGERPRTNRTLRVLIETKRHAALLYSASQIAVLDDAQIAQHPYLSRLGPDLLEPTLKPAAVARRMLEPRFGKKTIAALLLDQGFLAGSGNYLRSEILWDAKLDPMRRADSLDAKERGRFARSTLRIGLRAYRHDGVTNDPRRVARLKQQNPRRSYRYAIYTRDGKPCYACGTQIVREVATGRRIYRCPGCQPAVVPRKAPRAKRAGLTTAKTRPRRGGTESARASRRGARPTASS
ncbi:MAG TPA: endonuclease VIII [Xanthomonadales bacterium]|nr:endonuclease VIII [Xanthomonadales bacterium]